MLIATTSPGKIREVEGCLLGLDGWRLLSLRDIPPMNPVPETGATFEENAVLKATGYGRVHGGLTLADDSGLCVDALDGAPGVASARFGGAGLDDAGRLRLLLDRMADIPEGQRSARFICALALARGGDLLATFSGRVEGRLLHATRGENGFGYDPVFFHEASGCAFAELTRAEKEAVSHRGIALATFRRWLGEHPEIG